MRPGPNKRAVEPLKKKNNNKYVDRDLAIDISLFQKFLPFVYIFSNWSRSKILIRKSCKR
jgi:hypothetical protein